MAYAEGEEQPEGVRISAPKTSKRTDTEEVMGNVAYSQPHKVQKYRPELGGQSDNFENPYVVQNFPQQQQQPPMGYPPGYAGSMGRRKKRQALPDFGGIHRLLSTGIKNYDIFISRNEKPEEKFFSP